MKIFNSVRGSITGIDDRHSTAGRERCSAAGIEALQQGIDDRHSTAGRERCSAAGIEALQQA